MDSMAIIQEQKIDETMNRLAIIQEQKIVERTAGFSS